MQDDSVVTAAISSSIPQQFSHHALHFAVSYPPADPRINRHLFRTAQREYERGERGPASAVEDSGEQRQVPPRPAPWPNFSGASFGEAHLPPSVNWTVGGDESTVGAVTAAEEEDEEGRGGEDEAYPDSVGPDIGGGSRPRLRTTGATGHGAVSRRGGSPNLVAALAWSAPGLGRGGRCVLGVLGGMGALVVYGDGGDSTFPVGEHGIGEGGIGEDSAENRDDEDDDGDDDGRDDEGEYARPANRRDAAGSARHRRGGGAATRDLAASWRMIFGVGAHLPLPWPVGSSRRATWDAGVREHIVGFAWSREVVRNVPGVGGTGGGRALLAYATDADEVVLLAVASRFATDDDAAEWSVSELARFGAAGPHPRLLVGGCG